MLELKIKIFEKEKKKLLNVLPKVVEYLSN